MWSERWSMIMKRKKGREAVGIGLGVRIGIRGEKAVSTPKGDHKKIEIISNKKIMKTNFDDATLKMRSRPGNWGRWEKESNFQFINLDRKS